MKLAVSVVSAHLCNNRMKMTQALFERYMCMSELLINFSRNAETANIELVSEKKNLNEFKSKMSRNMYEYPSAKK